MTSLSLLRVPDENLPLYVGRDVRGYRSWCPSWHEGKPVLRPVHRGRRSAWHPGVNESTCYGTTNPDLESVGIYRHAESVPSARCCCGFWCYRNSDPPRDDDNLMCNLYAQQLATGAVELSGRIVEWEFGFRGQKARIVALAPARSVSTALAPHTLPSLQAQWNLLRLQIRHGEFCPCVWCKPKAEVPTLEQLGEAYGVPVFQSYYEMVDVFPPTDPRPATPKPVYTNSITAAKAAIQQWNNAKQAVKAAPLKEETRG